ncbi:hypothetical protein T484DRAFT_1810808, partial [Baffinella frigidus]
MLNTVAASTWQPIRADVCNALNKNKDAQILTLLRNVYADADVVDAHILSILTNVYADADVDAQILSILTNVYADADVVFLQETAHEFVSKLRNDKTLGARYS